MNITDYNLSDPLFNNIISNLYSIQLYQLKLTNKYFNNNITINLIKNQTIKIINQNLEIVFGNKLEEFKLLLNNIGIVITGSFVLECLWGNHYDYDIDILILQNSSNVIKLSNFLYEFGYGLQCWHDMHGLIKKYTKTSYNFVDIYPVINVYIQKNDDYLKNIKVFYRCENNLDKIKFPNFN
jgi:hypothetical protein